MKFSRQDRLLKPSEFKSVFRKHTRCEDRYFKVLARKNESTRHRLGMAVARKTCRRAVDRNRIKRIIRESFRQHVAGSTGGGTMDLVVMSKAESVAASNAMLRHSLERHWCELVNGAG